MDEPTDGQKTPDPELLLREARRYRELGDLDKAEAIYNGFAECETPETRSRVLAGLGYCQRRRGDHRAALSLFLKAEAADPPASGAGRDAGLAAAEELLHLGRVEEAGARFLHVLFQQSQNARAWVGIANCFRRCGHHQAALAWFQQAALADPENPAIVMELAAEQRARQDFKAAHAQYIEVLRRLPNQNGALIGLGYCERGLGNRTAALACFEKALARRPGEVEAAIAAGEELLALDRPAEAVSRFADLLAGRPDFTRALMGLAQAHRQLGNRDAALASLRKAAAAAPDNTAVILALADELRALGHSDEAEERYRLVLKTSPRHLRALTGLGYCLRARGDRGGALASFQAALAANSESADLANAVGEELAALGRLDDALAQFQAVLDHSPADKRALFGRANAFRRQGRRPQAIAELRAFLASHPGDFPARLALCEELREAGDLAAALALAEELAQERPDNVAAALAVGRALRQSGQREAALAAFRHAAEIAAGSAQPLLEMASEERALGRLAEARSLLERAISLAPAEAAPLTALAEILALSDEHEPALELCRRAIDLGSATVWAYTTASKLVFELGRFQEAIALLDAAERRFGTAPEIAARRSELLAASGRWGEALAIAQAASLAHPAHFWSWRQRADLELRIGDPAATQRLLRETPASTPQEQSEAELRRGLFAADRWQFGNAIECFERALALNPYNGGAAIHLAASHLLTLDVKRSREFVRQHIDIEAAQRSAQRLASNISQTHVGQLIDEYALEPAALNEMRAALDLDLSERLSVLRAIAGAYPEYTPAAMTLLIAMRQAGLLRYSGSREQAGQTAIPGRIAQYWHSANVPEDIRELMASWSSYHPDYEIVRFDDGAARRFLSERFPEHVIAAYVRARDFAQKADLFRLAWLHAEGGHYVDADDRCRAPLPTIVSPDCEFVVYHEDFGTIGNNYIGSVAGHPLIERALNEAAASINRGDTDLLWLSTGPGLMTRAIVSLLPAGGDALPPRILILEKHDLYRAVATHCYAAYKRTAQHWKLANFSKRHQRLQSHTASA